MGRSVAVVTYQFSVVVKSMEKGLTDKDYDVVLLEDDEDQILAVMDTTEVFLVYLQDSVLGDIEKVKELLLLCDMFEDHGRHPIFIGAANSRDAFFKVVPALKNYVWVDRPVDMYKLIKDIEKEAKRREDLNAKKRILIIDDDPFSAQIVSEWLKNLYTVSTCADGMEGISWLVKNKVDLILLDYEMPVVDGPKVLEMLRMHSETAHIPVIFLTGIGTKESIRRVLSLKPQGYILKTTTRDDLIKNLEEFFEKQGK